MRFLFFLFLFFYFVPKFCETKTDGFKIANIQSSLTFEGKWETDPLSEEKKEEIKILLNQPFHYLGCGGQCYAFVSEDDQYVIKFFKHHLRRLPWLFAHLPLPSSLEHLRERQREKRARKLDRDFNSYKLAYENLRKETGLIYIHLNKSEDWNQSIRIIDKLKITHTLPLDQLEFVVQKKAELFLDHLDELMQKNKLEEAQSVITSVFDLIIHRSKQGIFDEDPRLHCNLGWHENSPLLIDVGRLKFDPIRATAYKQDLPKITKRLKLHLQEHYPLLDAFFEKTMRQIVEDHDL